MNGRAPGRRVKVAGFISSAGFRDGHRFVVGHWPISPIGPMSDVMWATPDNERVLLTATDDAASFITSIYAFDQVRIGPLDIASDGTHTIVDGHGIRMELFGGRRRPIPIPRPLSFTRYIEAPIARRLMGVETYGTSPTGAIEWYQTRGWRWVIAGEAALNGRNLGSVGPMGRPLCVGFSEPPASPSIVGVHVTIDRPRTP